MDNQRSCPGRHDKDISTAILLRFCASFRVVIFYLPNKIIPYPLLAKVYTRMLYKIKNDFAAFPTGETSPSLFFVFLGQLIRFWTSHCNPKFPLGDL